MGRCVAGLNVLTAGSTIKLSQKKHLKRGAASKSANGEQSAHVSKNTLNATKYHIHRQILSSGLLMVVPKDKD